MSDSINKSIEQLLNEQIEAQKQVLEATERRVRAETEAAQLSRESIKKYEEVISTQLASKRSSDELMNTIELLIHDVRGAISVAKPLEQVIGKIDILIQTMQLLIQIVNQLNGVSKQHLSRLEEQLFKLSELNAIATRGITIHQSSSNIGSVEANQANIAENLKALQNEIENNKKDEIDN